MCELKSAMEDRWGLRLSTLVWMCDAIPKPSLTSAVLVWGKNDIKVNIVDHRTLTEQHKRAGCHNSLS